MIRNNNGVSGQGHVDRLGHTRRRHLYHIPAGWIQIVEGRRTADNLLGYGIVAIRAVAPHRPPLHAGLRLFPNRGERCACAVC